MNAWTLLIFSIAFSALSINLVEGGKAKDICLKLTGVTDADVQKQYLDPDPSKRVKCFLTCFLGRRNISLFNSKVPGGFKAAFSHLLKPEAIDRVEEKCHQGQIVPNPKKWRCDYGWRLFLCYELLVKADLIAYPNLTSLRTEDQVGSVLYDTVPKTIKGNKSP